MSDHHVDSMKIDYPKKAKEILLRTGMYIPGAPEINHKPGNDFLSDVYYPFPNYPDTRFAMVDNSLKQDTKPSSVHLPVNNKLDTLEETYPNKIDNKPRRTPLYHLLQDRTLIENTIFPYTGTVTDIYQKKAVDIKYIKKDTYVTAEVVTSHLYSIATFDGSFIHIFRGKCIDIITATKSNTNIKTLDDETLDDRVRGFVDNKLGFICQMRIVLDVSELFDSKREFIPIPQIIDIQDYDHEYNFDEYKIDIKVKHDWYVTDPNSKLETTHVPSGYYMPETKPYPIIEHQKIHHIVSDGETNKDLFDIYLQSPLTLG